MPLFEIYEDPEKGFSVRRGRLAEEDMTAVARAASKAKAVVQGLHDLTNKSRPTDSSGTAEAKKTWSRQMAEKLINPPRRAQPYKSPPPSASPEAPRGSAAPPLPPRSPPARTAPPEPARRAPEPPPAATHDATKWLGTVFARPEDSDEATRVVSTRSPVPVEVRSDVSSKQDVTWWECDFCGLPFTALAEAQTHEEACSKTSNNPARAHELSPIPELQTEASFTASPHHASATQSDESAHPHMSHPSKNAYRGDRIRARLFAASPPRAHGVSAGSHLSDSPTDIFSSSSPAHDELQVMGRVSPYTSLSSAEPVSERGRSKTPPPPARSLPFAARRPAEDDVADDRGVLITATVVYGDAAGQAMSPGVVSVPVGREVGGKRGGELERLAKEASEAMEDNARLSSLLTEAGEREDASRERQKLNERRNAQLRADLSATQAELLSVRSRLDDAERGHEQVRMDMEARLDALSRELSRKTSQANNLAESLRVVRSRLRIHEPLSPPRPAPSGVSFFSRENYHQRGASASPGISTSPPPRASPPAHRYASLPPPPPLEARQWWPSKSASPSVGRSSQALEGRAERGSSLPLGWGAA